MKSIVYQAITTPSEIDKVWEAYHQTKDRKLRAELRNRYKRLVEEDTKQSGFKRYNYEILRTHSV